MKISINGFILIKYEINILYILNLFFSQSVLQMT